MSTNDDQIVRVIGEGAYGRAILCTEKATGQEVVVNEIKLAGLSLREKNEAKKETDILRRLDHPNIIRCRGSFIERNNLHIVMDFADGGDLFAQVQRVKKEHFKEERVLSWFVQICLALKHIHDRKILHRDIKCQNIFLTKGIVVKMGDFGISKVLDHTAQFAKTSIGTPYYLSPEIC
jgi:NIMA (never in mitosis gene a)-related kinase